MCKCECKFKFQCKYMKDPVSIFEFLGMFYCHQSVKSKLLEPFSPNDDQKQVKNDRVNAL